MSTFRNLMTSDRSFPQFVRFILVGLLNTAVGYLIFAGFVLLSIPAQVALAAAFVLGVVWNFGTHARLVFRQSGFSRLPQYIAVYCAVWALNALALAGAHWIGVGPLLAQAGLAPLAAVLSFFLIARVLTGSYPVFSRN
jgi:putative flippase GtrA